MSDTIGRRSALSFPITKTEPRASRFAAEIPTTEKRRAGLDMDLRLWIVLDEYNVERIGHSHYLEDSPPLGVFSKAFFLPLAKEFVARCKAIRASIAPPEFAVCVATRQRQQSPFDGLSKGERGFPGPLMEIDLALILGSFCRRFTSLRDSELAFRLISAQGFSRAPIET